MLRFCLAAGTATLALSVAGAAVAAPFAIVADAADASPMSTGVVDRVTSDDLRVGRDATGINAAAVFPFLLPALAEGESYSAVTLTVVSENGTTQGFAADLYGLTRFAAAPDVLAADFYEGEEIDLANVLLADAFIPANTAVTAGEAFVQIVTDFLNQQVAAGAMPGQDYIFFRLSQDSTQNGARYQIVSFDGAEGDRPLLAGEIVPEPATLALLGLGGLTCLVRRRTA